MSSNVFVVAAVTQEPLADVENTPDSFLVRLRRPDGSEYLLRVPEEHLQRVMDLANGEFGDKSIVLEGPYLPEPK